jgi:hypothetical protein
MVYYDTDYKNVATDSWYETHSSTYLTWMSGNEYSTANAAVFTAGQASSTNNDSTGQHGAPVFAAPETSAFGHHGSFGGTTNDGFIGAASGWSAFGTTSEDQRQVLISNEEEVKQDGQSYHLPKMVSVNAPLPD